MKVYITKYALTRGIIEAEGEICTAIGEHLISCNIDGWHKSFFKPFWHETKQEAVDHACDLRDKKVVSLEQKIKKLNAISFTDIQEGEEYN